MCKISVITICKNEKEHIRKTMDSVLTQEYSDLEYIVVDGGSTDGTVELIKDMMKCDKRVQMITEPDQGIYDAMNKGIALAQGEYIYFLNVKDYLYDEQVFSKIAEYMENAQNDIVIGKVIRERWMGNTIEGVNSYLEFKEGLTEGMCVCHQAIFAKRNYLVDGFDLSFELAADYNWLCKQFMAGRQIKIVDIIIAYYDVHGMAGNAKSKKISIAECCQIQKKYFNIDVDYKKKIQYLNKCIINEVLAGWFVLKQKGVNISSVLESKGIEKLAIYGMHTLGNILAEELDGTSIVVKCGIDKNCVFKDVKIPVVKPDDCLEAVDAVIITPMMDYCEIRKTLESKMDCQVISLEDIIGWGFELEGEKIR